MKKNYLQEAVKLYLTDNFFEVDGDDNSIYYKSKSNSLKEARISGDIVTFYFDDKEIFKGEIITILEENNSLLKYFIEE